MAQNTRLKAHKPIWSFDICIVDRDSKNGNGVKRPVFSKYGFNEKFASGDSFEDALRGFIKPVEDVVELNIGNILTFKWPVQPKVEVAFLDILKSAEVDQFIFKNVYDKFIPGHTIVIQQDYFYDRLAYLRIRQEYLADYFEYIGEIYSTAVFRLIKPIPDRLFRNDPVPEIPFKKQLALIDKAASRSIDPARRALTTLSKVRHIYELKGRSAASKVLAEFEIEYKEVVEDATKSRKGKYLKRVYEELKSEIAMT